MLWKTKINNDNGEITMKIRISHHVDLWDLRTFFFFYSYSLIKRDPKLPLFLLKPVLCATASCAPVFFWLSRCMLSVPIPKLQLKAPRSAAGVCTIGVAAEWRKQRGPSSVGWKIRPLPCNSVAGADIIRLWSDIRQVIPPTDCNR